MNTNIKIPTFCIETLGCKVNKTETISIKQKLLESGFNEVPFEAQADIYIINTCTVTAKSDFQSRQLARQAYRQNDKAKIIITGCYAQTSPEELRKLPGNIIILNNKQKGEILNHLGLDSKICPKIEGISSTQYTRAFLKIQDGCDWNCAYCIVPTARGKSVSLAKEEILNQARDFINKGFKEIVLTGIHIGRYGLDISPKTSLTELLKELVSLKGLGRIRLSSLEPVEFTDELIDLIKGSDKICRHFHIPLQSASDEILKAMGRNYSFELYRRLMLKLRDSFPDAALGCDVIVGFPGEDDNIYLDSYRKIAQLPLTHLHVFSYSKRAGTRAALMPNQVDEKIKKIRSKELRELGEKKKTEFYQNQLGAVRRCLILNQKTEGYLKALSDNYINIFIDGNKDFINQILPVRILNIKENKIFGKAV